MAGILDLPNKTNFELQTLFFLIKDTSGDLPIKRPLP